jgi:hypothetical protein
MTETDVVAPRRIGIALPARVGVRIALIWILAATGLSVLTERVRDWFVMTDELLYERLAISIGRGHLLPEVHGTIIPALNHLYPLLIAPAFAHGLVPGSLREAHILNAWLMSSACIPAILLARRVCDREWLPYFVGALTICMPWIFYSSFLLTEVAAYPAFVWALLAMQRCVAEPSRRNDVFALLGLALAFFARTQFAVLVAVLPVAVLSFSVARRRPVLAEHRLLVGVYSLLAVVAVVLASVGRLSSVFGVYSVIAGGDLFPAGMGSSLLAHLALFSVGVGVLPLVVALGWLLANTVDPPGDADAHAFAAVGLAALGALLLEVASYDQRLGIAYVHDRYLLYLVPLVLVACAAAAARRPPAWALVAPAALVALGFGIGGLSQLLWTDPLARVNADTPMVKVVRPLLHVVGSLGAVRIVLALATLAPAVLFALLPRRAFAAALTVFLGVALPVETAYVFRSLFGTLGEASRPLTGDQGETFSWVDRTVTPAGRVTMVPYAADPNYFVSQQVWRDLEFWNRSVVRDAHYGGERIYEVSGGAFPKLYLRFDATRGLVAQSPTRYVAESDKEARFRISGTVVALSQEIMLIDAGPAWRLDWLTLDVTPDGWTKPGTTARIRIFASPAQQGSVSRQLTVGIRPPDGVGARGVVLRSNLEHWQGEATAADTLLRTLHVCVPPGGHTDVTASTPDSSEIPGDPSNLDTLPIPRRGGIQLTTIALADETGGACTPA